MINNDFIFNELKNISKKINEVDNVDEAVANIIEGYDIIMDFQHISRQDGLLALEDACKGLNKQLLTQQYMCLLMDLVVDGTEPQMLKEIGINKYIMSEVHGTDALIMLMYLKGSIMIQCGDARHVIDTYIKSMMPILVLNKINNRNS